MNFQVKLFIGLLIITHGASVPLQTIRSPPRTITELTEKNNDEVKMTSSTSVSPAATNRNAARMLWKSLSPTSRWPVRPEPTAQIVEESTTITIPKSLERDAERRQVEAAIEAHRSALRLSTPRWPWERKSTTLKRVSVRPTDDKRTRSTVLDEPKAIIQGDHCGWTGRK